MSFQLDLATLFRRDLTRLIQEIQAFPGDAYLWKTVPGVKNAAGNLVLHLEGNLREYIGRQLGGVEYQRDRTYEFSAKDIPVSGLVARIEGVREAIPDIVGRLTDGQLEALFPEEMWGSRRATRLMLITLYGHFNFHLGQIGYLRRMIIGGGAVDFVQFSND